MVRIVITDTGHRPPDMEGRVRLLAQAMAAGGWPVLIAPDLYRQEPDGPAARRLREIADPIVLLSWMHPRAAFWLLDRLGVRGRMEKTNGSGERQIVCLTLDAQDTPFLLSERMDELAPGERRVGKGSVEEITGDGADRWYPVIDRKRCTDCLECLEFCLFGVYDVDSEGRLSVARPDLCKPGCPACSRVCPEQAVIFPLYADDPAVAGADGAKVKPFEAGAVARLREGLALGRTSVAEVISACACHSGAHRDGVVCADCPCNGDPDCHCHTDEFDGLIRRLDLPTPSTAKQTESRA
jgi:NAD-dependent dihydropyrimidine dehydrogenase PreA subunit